MAPPKRKRPQEDEQRKPVSAQPGLTRRVTRQSSISPPPLSVPPKPAALRRQPRTNTIVATGQDASADVIKPRGRGRPRRDAAVATTATKKTRGTATTAATTRQLRRADPPKAPSSRQVGRPPGKKGSVVADSEESESESGSEPEETDQDDGESEDDDNDDDDENENHDTSTSAAPIPPPTRRSRRTAAETPPELSVATKKSKPQKDQKVPLAPSLKAGEISPPALIRQHPQTSVSATTKQILPARTRGPIPTAAASPATPAASAAMAAPLAATTASRTPRKLSQAAAPPPPSPGRPDRNIDKVVLGKICFRAWYPSYYGKEVLGETSGNTHHGKGHPGGHHGKGPERDGQHRHSAPILDRLYVCPFCFKYSKEIVPWWGHVQICEREFQIPGEKVYVHPKGIRTVHVPVTQTLKNKRRRGSAEQDVQYTVQVVQDLGEWSIWEVDGEKDGLFCQNLSLFAKLFLDNKSVFFDVAGFHYFLLVYTPAQPSEPDGVAAEHTAVTTAPAAAAADSMAHDAVGAVPRSRVVGFFSKEKMSWDNNNLACILVFPPWQRKGLGSLLMGVSYEISRREGVLGGPEKPISDLGKKGYRRFWAGEIARWLLSIDVSAYAAAGGGGGEGGVEGQSDEEKVVVIDTGDISQATWIVRDDCLLVLREMGIVEDAGMGPPKVLKREGLTPVSASAPGSGSGVGGGAVAGSNTAVASGGADEPGAAGATGGAAAATTTTTTAEALRDAAKEAPDVQRVRISKAAVRQWIADNGISLEKACDPAGFVKVYARKDVQQAADEV